MTLGGYSKLFGSILTSSIWEEDDATRIVWITCLAMKDRNGIVKASLPALARFANVRLEATAAAIEKLTAPDPSSRTPEHDGRRLEVVQGGWRVVNHFRYRAEVSNEPAAAADRERQQRRREKQADAPSPTPLTQEQEKIRADADTASRDVTVKTVTSRSTTTIWETISTNLWIEQFRTIPGYSALSQVEAEAVWMQMQVYRPEAVIWAAIGQAWEDFTRDSLESAFPRPLKVWRGYLRRAVQGPVRKPGRSGAEAAKPADHANGGW